MFDGFAGGFRVCCFDAEILWFSPRHAGDFMRHVTAAPRTMGGMAETCERCGAPRHDVKLPSRYADCKTCGGRIHHYPPPSSDIAAPAAGTWVHLSRADWVDNPHVAEPAVIDVDG